MGRQERYETGCKVNRRTLFFEALAGVAAFSILTGCQPFQRESRVAMHADSYRAASSSVQGLISQGRVEPGMTRTQVYLALGVPDRIKREIGSPQVVEEWTYEGRPERNFTLLFRLGILQEIRGNDGEAR